MASDLKILYEIQLIDTQIERIEKARSGLNDGSGLVAEVERLTSELDRQRKRLHDLEAEYQDQDLKLKAIETKRQQHRDRLFSGKISNPKELENLRREIEMLTRNKGASEESLLSLMDEIEAQKQLVSDLDRQSQTKTIERDAHLQDYAERVARLNAQLEEVAVQRQSLTAQIEAERLTMYDRLRRKSHNLAVVKVESNMCPGCGVTLTAYALRRLDEEREDDVVCENCNRLLYREHFE